MPQLVRLFLLGGALLLAGASARAQSLYFPPTAPADTAWAHVAPRALGWNLTALDTVLAYAGRKHSKALLIVQDGRLAVEHYYGSFSRDSAWYWASASKSLTATLIGLARQDGRVQLGNPVTQYLGAGWTSAPAAKEPLITVRHLLTMTSGLNDALPPTPGNSDPNTCPDPACLQYLADAGTRWAYHTGAYRRLLDVLATTSGQNITIHTATRLGNRIGMRGLWLDGVFYSKARDMARFGLLTLARGAWNGTSILTDTAYFRQMTTRSQTLNHAYGYLWWLNGQDTYMAPQVRLTFPGAIMPPAPIDLVAALGKNDQKIYVVPSRNLVVVRLGEASGQTTLALSSFDNELWTRLMLVFQSPTGVPESTSATFTLSPNPATDRVTLSAPAAATVCLLDATGRVVRQAGLADGGFSVRGLPAGLYLVQITATDGQALGRRRLVVQ